MKNIQLVFYSLMVAALIFTSCANLKKSGKSVATTQMIIRISEIDIHPEFIEAYNTILKEESEASVRLEPGVISIYPMHKKENPSEVRILEIYASKEAYEAHLKTPHFQKYKTTTLKMVKALRLVDMSMIDPQTMPKIFSKMN